MALTAEQQWIATKIDTRMQKLIRAGKDNMTLMAAMAVKQFKHWPSEIANRAEMQKSRRCLSGEYVPVALPHEHAWREALSGFTDPNLFTTAVYLAHVAGKTRLVGARSALEALGVPDAGRLAVLYADRKEKWLEYLIQDGDVAAPSDQIPE